MLKIYGSDLSGPAIKVKFTANALGLQFDFQPINLREGENKTEWFLKINPVGKIPAIDDDGFTLFESGAICKYLCRKHRSDLYPSDVKACALIDQWIDFSTIHIGVAMGRVLYNRVFAPLRKLEVDERSLQDGLKFLDQFLPVVDAQLGKNEFLASNKFSLADITLLSVLEPAEIAEVDLSSYAHVIRWRNTLRQQPFYTKTYKEYGESLKEALAHKGR
jgi:glutathione S-transferase